MAHQPEDQRGPVWKRSHRLGAVCGVLAAVSLALSGVPSALAAGGDSTSWALTDFADPHPARLNPCATVKVAINAAQSPAPGAVDDVLEAMWRVGHETGVVFEYVGPSTFMPQAGNNTPAGVDILVAWASHSDSTLWGAADPTAQAFVEFSSVYQSGGASADRMESTAILYNTATTLASGFDSASGPSRGEILMHELGHASGLAHPAKDDRAQIMNAVSYPVHGQWGAGDLNGLAAVSQSQGRCLYDTQSEAVADQGVVVTQPAEPFPGTQFTPAASASPTATSTSSQTPTDTSTPTAAPAPTVEPTATAPPPPPHNTPTLTATRLITCGQTGTITLQGTPGAAVTLQAARAPGGTYANVQQLVVGSNGSVSAPVRSCTNTSLRGVDPEATSQVGPAASMLVRPAVTLGARQVRTRVYTYYGAVKPGRGSQPITVYQHTSRGWVVWLRTRAASNGTWTITHTFASSGRITLQAGTGADSINAAGTSLTHTYSY